jgi:hypothetical protein
VALFQLSYCPIGAEVLCGTNRHETQANEKKHFANPAGRVKKSQAKKTRERYFSNATATKTISKTAPAISTASPALYMTTTFFA